jgi:hypothetical protein
MYEEPAGPERIALLWQLAWDDRTLACVIYRDDRGMELRVESDAAVIIRERFDLQPRALARAQTLRASLKRRGWQESISAV